MSLPFLNRKNRTVKSENDLILLAKKDSRYFAPIYKKYYEPIFRFIYQRMDREEDTADLTSQVFLKALLNLTKYENRGYPFSSWLYKIALNEVNQFYRKTKKQRTVSLDESHIAALIDEAGDGYSEEKKEKLLIALGALSADKISLIEMRYFEKRAFREIAMLLSITENNAKVRTYRVLDELKKNML